MHHQLVSPDIYNLVGGVYSSNSTLIVSGDEALLIDAMASAADAEKLRSFVESELGKRVRFIISTHYFSDHLAALKLFPQASIIAHQNYTHTFDLEIHRTEEEKAHFVKPNILISDGMTMCWGHYELDIFHNPAHTMSTINIDISAADLLLVGDNVVGNLVYLHYSTPALHKRALERLRRRDRAHVIQGHQGVVGRDTIENALCYLDGLERQVQIARAAGRGDPAVLEISLEQCLPDVLVSDFERKYHGRNLETIIDRGLF